MTDPLVGQPSTHEAHWMVLSLASANAIAWTTDREELDEWMIEIRTGDWGDVGVAEYDENGNLTGSLWPEEER